MKTIVYNGNSKIIKRIVALLNGKAPMPLDANNDVTWGTNGQVLTTDGTGATSWTAASGGDTVSFSQTLASGTESGTITINGTGTKIYAPTPPTKLSDLSNDSGFITSTVNNLTNYYKKSETYTQAEVDSLISAIVTLDIQVVQTLPTQNISTTTIYLVPKATAETQDIYDEYIYVNNAWEHIGSTQVDLSNYYNKTEVDDLLADKVDKVTGKGLSTEDFTSTLKTKLDGIETGAEVNVQANWNEADTTSDAYIQNKPTIPTVNNGTVTFMQGNTNLGSFSANQSSNATITIPTPSIDINNETPTFTEASTRANIASGETISTLFGKIKKFFTDLASVAFSGSYNDLSDKPTIPTVNNATLTIQKNGTTVNTFTANSSSNVTCNITMSKSDVGLGNVDNTADANKSVNYANSAGSAPANGGNSDTVDSMHGWELSTLSASGTSHNRSYILVCQHQTSNDRFKIKIADGYESRVSVDGLEYTGTANNCFTVYQGSGAFMGRSDWATYLIGNHGDGATYYSQTIALPFWGVPEYRRLENGVDKGWKQFVTDENLIYKNDILVTSRTTWQSYSENCGKTIKSVMVCPSGRNENGSFQCYATFSGTTWTVYYRNPVDYSGDGFTVWIFTQ